MMTQEVIVREQKLDIPKCQFTSEGELVIAEDTTLGEWVDIGRNLRRAEGAIQWAIGKWLSFGEHKYGSKYAQAALETGYDKGYLANIKYVTERVSTSLRNENLTFSHHVVVAPLPPKEQKQWLDKTEKEKLSVRQLRQEINPSVEALPPPKTESQRAALLKCHFTNTSVTIDEDCTRKEWGEIGEYLQSLGRLTGLGQTEESPRRRLLSRIELNRPMEFHKETEIIPPMTKSEFEELIASIREIGLIYPITIYQGKILDGRMRYLACKEAGVEPRYVEWDGKGSKLGFLISMNVKRQHLTEDQRAMCAVGLIEYSEKYQGNQDSCLQTESGKPSSGGDVVAPPNTDGSRGLRLKTRKSQ